MNQSGSGSRYNPTPPICHDQENRNCIPGTFFNFWNMPFITTSVNNSSRMLIGDAPRKNSTPALNPESPRFPFHVHFHFLFFILCYLQIFFFKIFVHTFWFFKKKIVAIHGHPWASMGMDRRGYGTTPIGCRGGSRYVDGGIQKISRKGHELTEDDTNYLKVILINRE